MTFPVTDWQFWTVTLSAIGALWVLVKPFLPGDETEESTTPCSRCAVGSGSRCQDDGPKLVTLGGGKG